MRIAHVKALRLLGTRPFQGTERRPAFLDMQGSEAAVWILAKPEGLEGKNYGFWSLSQKK